MGSRTGIVDYEFRKKDLVKSVATEVVSVQSESLEKTVAEELKVVDPPNAQEIIEEAKAAESVKVVDTDKEEEVNAREEDVKLHSEDIKEPESKV